MRQRAKEGPWKQEQINILEYEASLQERDLICINALAPGCGKTTMIALLCNHLQDIGNEILYNVFGKKEAQEEACASNKFPKENITIASYFTCFCQKALLSHGNFMVCEPTSGYETEDVIFVLNLFK
jgi:hypothetical protein